MTRIDSSFRDSDGYMFEKDEELFRAVNPSYQKDYDHLISSGLYDKLTEKKLMVPFEEVDPSQFGIDGLYKVIKPERIRFISYPYEWAFDMLKDAALLTLEIQKLALEYGMSLKDASAFNVQFKDGRPIFIDSLSFESYPVNRPWIAYRQFCQHFLAPLALMANINPSLNRLFILYIDGIPLELAAKMLPTRCRLSLGLLLHVYMHSTSQKKNEFKNTPVSNIERKFSLRSMNTLIEALKSAVDNQIWKSIESEWGNYTGEGVHKEEYTVFKTTLISKWLDDTKPQVIWDLGANTGYYSRLASQRGINVISFDADPTCVEINYKNIRENEETYILPLLMDITNSSPSIGWRGLERSSLFQRNHPDLIMALAIIHHLAISTNIPLESIALSFAELADKLIIEFVPKEDDKVQFLLLNREDIFSDYNQSGFENAFSKYYNTEQRVYSDCNQRVFYLMRKK